MSSVKRDTARRTLVLGGDERVTKNAMAGDRLILGKSQQAETKDIHASIFVFIVYLCLFRAAQIQINTMPSRQACRLLGAPLPPAPPIAVVLSV